MCGICGVVVAPGEALDTAALSAMNNSLRPRGPDDEGFYIDPRGGCGLGHRRLSIIDLAGGRQPLSARGGRVQIIANGEIYNFMELREELIAEGHEFSTNSDCEVIAKGYEAWGEAVFSRLWGMFALAIWDADSRRLYLARDRMGKKPLYYAALSGQLIFGSELKALLSNPAMPRQLSQRGLAAYLTYESFPDDLSVYEHAHKLPAGSFLCYERASGKLRVEPYWRLRFSGSPEAQAVAGRSVSELTEQLQDRIREATRARLVSDVPLGVLLSGGVDSSTVAAAMADCVPPSQIKTFSVRFEEASFDESSHARLVAKTLGTEHHEETLSPRRMLDILPEVADTMCEPIGDGSIMPTYLLSDFTRRSVTVALGGDGGDEAFLGYPTFQAEAVAERLDKIVPASLQRHIGGAIGWAAGRLPVSTENMSFEFKLKRFAQGLGYKPGARHQAWMGSFLPAELEAVLAPQLRKDALRESPYARIARLRAESDARDGLDQLVLQYIRYYLESCVLVKVDRASMAHALEVRAPLLDPRVVQFAAAIPGRLRRKGFTTKYLLKEVARRWLPAEIVDRPKKGFGMPIGRWLRGDLRELGEALLAPERLSAQALFTPSEVRRLWHEHQEGQADHRKPLWTLLSFQLWWDRYGPDAPRAPLPPPLSRDNPKVAWA